MGTPEPSGVTPSERKPKGTATEGGELVSRLSEVAAEVAADLYVQGSCRPALAIRLGELAQAVQRMVGSEREEAARLRAEVRRLREAGRPMANWFFNVAQRPEAAVGQGPSMRAMWRAWDAADSPSPAPQGEKGSD